MNFVAAKRLMDASLDSVLGNLLLALKVAALPFLIFAAICLVAFFPDIVAGTSGSRAAGAGDVLKILLVVFSGIFLFYLTVVSWHRAVLLSKEERSHVPASETLRYCLKSIGASFLFLLVALLVIMPVSAATGRSITISVGDFVTAYHQGMAELVLTFLFTWGFWFWYLAVSPALVAAALGQKVGIFEALRENVAHRPTVRAVATIMTACMLVYSVIGAGVPAIPVAVYLFVQAVILWLVFVFSISLLTQYYALCVSDKEQTTPAI